MIRWEATSVTQPLLAHERLGKMSGFRLSLGSLVERAQTGVGGRQPGGPGPQLPGPPQPSPMLIALLREPALPTPSEPRRGHHDVQGLCLHGALGGAMNRTETSRNNQPLDLRGKSWGSCGHLEGDGWWLSGRPSLSSSLGVPVSWSQRALPSSCLWLGLSCSSS